MGLPKQSRETKFSGANGDREILSNSVQLATSRIGNLTRLIFTLAICNGHRYMYGHTYSKSMDQPGKVLPVLHVVS